MGRASGKVMDEGVRYAGSIKMFLLVYPITF